MLFFPFLLAVQNYQDFACCAAVKGNGSNVEYALHLLYLAKGDIQTAMLMLMGDPPVLPTGHGLLTYKYQGNKTLALLGSECVCG